MNGRVMYITSDSGLVLSFENAVVYVVESFNAWKEDAEYISGYKMSSKVGKRKKKQVLLCLTYRSCLIDTQLSVHIPPPEMPLAGRQKPGKCMFLHTFPQDIYDIQCEKFK